MDLSVIIVNYNVKYFIEQCLHSVEKAVKNIDSEVFVVDNNSVDGSCEMIRSKFPKLNLIENKVNLGFSKANNQAIQKSKGKYVLLLNPDTLVEEDSFRKCIDFMDTHPDAGALGVKMIDGTGNFLPESKRALPRPDVAFYKIFGLASLFPRSKVFGKYHLTYLDKDKIHEIDVLSGAYMLLRKEALNKTGLLDENFFMYGEDIDLSYRIQQSGYKNYYFPKTTIIHYKGESTKKGSINYVLVFYRAMIIFANKHFSTKNARLLSLLINLAIYFRATLSIVRRSIKRIYQPLIDALLFFAGFFFLTPVWEKLNFGVENYYPDEYMRFIVPSYILTWLVVLYYSGAYERPVKIWNIFKGHLTGTFIILIFYALLPEHLRFSRALILLGSVWVIFALLIHRLSLNLLGFSDYEFAINRKKRLIIVGEMNEAIRVKDILEKTRVRPEVIGLVSPGEQTESGFLGYMAQLEEMVKIHHINEIVFCSRNIPAGDIIRQMTRLKEVSVEYKIAPPESLSIIGSSSINTLGELYVVNFNSVSKGRNRRNKRLFDIVSSLLIILLSPFLIFFFKDYNKFLKNSMLILLGKYTWLAYVPGSDLSSLPPLRRGIFTVAEEYFGEINPELAAKLNFEYARDYKVSVDMNILWKNLFKSMQQENATNSQE
jgi:GT2 family glycosyltransferase